MLPTHTKKEWNNRYGIYPSTWSSQKELEKIYKTTVFKTSVNEGQWLFELYFTETGF